MAATLSVWLAVFLTLGVFSWMYKENPWFHFAENMYIGASLGHLAVTGFQNLKEIAVGPLVNENKYYMLIPILLGMLLFSRWTDKYAWMSRASMGFLVGTTAAVVMMGAIRAQLIQQVVATMMPLTSVNNVIFVVLTIAATTYFLFTMRNKSAQKVMDLGKYVLMVAFGATFGNTVMSRISLFTGRAQFLLFQWLKIGQ